MLFAPLLLAASAAASLLTAPQKRQVVAGTGCAAVDVNLPRTVDGLCATPALEGLCSAAVEGVLSEILTTTLAAVGDPLVSLCLCTEAGVLTEDSVADLEAQLELELSVLSAVDVLLLEVLPIDLTAILTPIAAAQVTGATADCDYPANSTPICSSTACDFVCNTGFQPCNGQCIPNDDLCSSPAARQRRRTVSNDLLCPYGHSACAIPGNKFGFECLDIRSDIESCGGCAFPLPGATKGTDCTAVFGALDVSCQQGKCVVESCLEGYALKGGVCESAV